MTDENTKQVVDACLDALELGNFVKSEITKVKGYPEVNQDDSAQLEAISSQADGILSEVSQIKISVDSHKETTASNIMSLMSLYTNAMDSINKLKALNNESVNVITNAKQRSV